MKDLPHPGCNEGGCHVRRVGECSKEERGRGDSSRERGIRAANVEVVVLREVGYV